MDDGIQPHGARHTERPIRVATCVLEPNGSRSAWRKLLMMRGEAGGAGHQRRAACRSLHDLRDPPIGIRVPPAAVDTPRPVASFRLTRAALGVVRAETTILSDATASSARDRQRRAGALRRQLHLSEGGGSITRNLLGCRWQTGDAARTRAGPRIERNWLAARLLEVGGTRPQSAKQ